MLIATVTGISMYGLAVFETYKEQTDLIAKSTAQNMYSIQDLYGMIDDMMSLYYSIPAEERKETGTEGYRKKFYRYYEDSRFKIAYSILDSAYQSSDLSDVYLGVYDPATRALIYVCDPDTEEDTRCYPGEWEPLSKRELDKFLSYTGGDLPHDFSNTGKYGFMYTVGVPLYDEYDLSETGDSHKGYRAFLLVDVTLSEYLLSLTVFGIGFILFMIVVVFLLSLLITGNLSNKIVKPLNMISDAVEGYTSDRKKKEEIKEMHFDDLDMHAGDEFDSLCEVLSDMEHALVDREEHLKIVTAKEEHRNTELALAARIQEDALPNTFPAFPERTDFDIFATMDPAREVGGDFYDFFMTDEDHLVMMIADVSGKGVPAALFMMMSKNILDNSSMIMRSPARILETANDMICANNREEMFVTVWLGILEISTGIITSANAGHEYPETMEPGGRFQLLKDRHGFVIGGMEGMKYKDYQIKMEPGSKIFVYTDGVTEAINKDNALFGTDRMTEALNRDPEAAPETILNNVQDAVNRFVADMEQFDDMTMLCLEYRGSREKE